MKTYRTGLLGRGGVPAVRGVTLAVPLGSTFALLGPNRAGKTTLVKLLLGLCRKSAGTISRLGQGVHCRNTLARTGYMHENHAFPRYLSAAELLGFYGGLSGVPAVELPARVARLLERVGLGRPPARADRPVQQGHGAAARGWPRPSSTPPTC